jgi:hypothetical protein
MARIGILTSTVFSNQFGNTTGTDFRTAFEAGFGAAPSYATNSPQEALGKYSADGKVHKALYQGVDQLQKQGANPAEIIVAVGGLLAAHAAVERSKVPFLVLIGRVPETCDFDLTDNDQYRGGINQRAANSNQDRADALVTTFGIAKSNIWLLFNPNSRTGKAEAHEWRQQGGHTVPAAISVDDDPNGNDPGEFRLAFQRLQRNNAAGVVISGDPFFAQRRNELVTAANNAFNAAGMVMCYPFEIFGNANPVPVAGSGINIGPLLLGAYLKMGQKAASLAGPGPGALNNFQGLDTMPLTALHRY